MYVENGQLAKSGSILHHLAESVFFIVSLLPSWATPLSNALLCYVKTTDDNIRVFLCVYKNAKMQNFVRFIITTIFHETLSWNNL